MREFFVKLIALAMLTVGTSANADQTYFLENGFTPKWERGDLIFQETRGPEAEMLKEATGSVLTHVGILRASGGGPIVLESTPDFGTFETDLGDFLKRGVGNNYAIYRIKGVQPPDDWYHPLVLAATEYVNTPYDQFYRDDSSQLYSSELIIKAAHDIGVDLKSPVRLGTLDVEHPITRAYFLNNWKENPACKNRALTKEQCWEVLKNSVITTPYSLAKNARLELIYSTFPSSAKIPGS